MTIATKDQYLPVTPSDPSRPADWINLLGVRVSAVNLDLAVQQILLAISAGKRGYICVRDAHGLVRAQSDDALRRAHNNAFLVTPDGMPLVWALKLSGHRAAGRVYGPDLMQALFEAGRGQNVAHFLYGTTPENLALLADRLRARFPGARIVGSYAPPFRALTAAESQDVVRRINSAGADIVWVGLSTPKQELWMQEMRDSLLAPMLIGVGAAFDFHAGNKKQAPKFIQSSGMEWAFRLACEPRRLLRRYAVTIPSFIWLVLAQVMRLRRFPIDEPPMS